MSSSRPANASSNGAVDPDSAYELWGLLAQFYFTQMRPRIMSVARELDLTPSHAMLLLKLEDPRSMGELAEFMHCDNSNVTGLVKRLEQKGLIERKTSTKDRRVKMITLTRKGRSARKSVLEAKRQPLPGLDNLSAAERAELGESMRKLMDQEPAAG